MVFDAVRSQVRCAWQRGLTLDGSAVRVTAPFRSNSCGELHEFVHPTGRGSLSPNAITVLEKRYLLKDEAGKPVETAEDLFWRVARTIAEPDRRYGASDGRGGRGWRSAFYELMAERLFMPNSPTLMNAGRPLGQLSACFVLPVDDALSNGKSGIYDTLRAMALVHQSGGGTGFSFSRLRPKNDIVRSTMGVASGPVSFMRLFDASTDVVKQGGTRRGANMGILRVDHPDIMEFITCKDDTTKITNFNISVAVTDAFMAAVEADGDVRPDPSQDRQGGRAAPRARGLGADHPRRLEDRRAGRLLHRPGQPLQPGAAPRRLRGHQSRAASSRCCRTTSATSARSTSAPSSRTGEIDWDRLRRVVHLSTHFLENVIDANQYPLPEITDLAQRIRRIGLGVMGLADLFVKLGIAYDSEEGVELGRRIQQFVDEEAKRESERLADGPRRLPGVGAEHLGPRRDLRARRRAASGSGPMRRLRNCNVTTVAPDRHDLDHRRAAAPGSSRCSPWRSCGTRPAC